MRLPEGFSYENEEEYRRLGAAQNARTAVAGVGVNAGQVVTLGKIGDNIGHAVSANL